MRFFIADDCNSTWDDKMDFFLYGGIVVKESEARTLAEGLLEIKENAGIRKERPIKWTNNNWRSQDVLNEELHASVKRKILEMVSNSNIKIIVCLSPQMFYHNEELRGEKIWRGVDQETKIRTHKFGLNDSLSKFNEFLEEVDELGLILADEFGDDIRGDMENHCFEIFPNGTGRYCLDKIIHPVIRLDNEDSYLHQINDVVLGAVYFSLREAEHNFLPLVKNNFWRDKEDDYKTSLGKGFNIYPLQANKNHIYQAKERLRSKFLRLIEA